jgi:4-hydroxythreonine-4-phosphate dehydrogenase
MKPYIGITMGDPAGIGPEIITKALNDSAVYRQCNPVVIGEKRILQDAVKMSGLNLEINAIGDIRTASYLIGMINIIDIKNIGSQEIMYGKVNADLGRASGEYIEKAIELALQKEIDAMVTAPINKESFYLGGYGKKYMGHTEMLAALTGSNNVSMVLAHGLLRIIHVTSHVSMRKALDLITKENILKTIHVAFEACRQLGIESPKIAVAGLNPHCGEGGLMGDEEIEEIRPAVEQALAEGLDVAGPIPADTVFPKGEAGVYDIVVALYHDQGHIPVKLKGFKWENDAWSDVRGVNITFGLPIIRTSVDHGTAYGKAGKGCADEKSLIDAISCAVKIAKNRDSD